MRTSTGNGLLWEYCFDQGNTLHCTLYAISRAVCTSSRRHGKLFNFDEILYKLRQLLTMEDEEYPDEGWEPMKFNGLILPEVSYSDSMGQAENQCGIEIKVERLPNLNFNSYESEDEYVLVEIIEPNPDTRLVKSHCMHAICEYQSKVDNLVYFLCRNSEEAGSRSNRYRDVCKSKPFNELYLVKILIMNGMEYEIEIAMNAMSLGGGNNNSIVKAVPSVDEIDYNHNLPILTASNIGQQYINSSGRVLQCISYAVSECCKERGFYIHPNKVQTNIFTSFIVRRHKNPQETAVCPEEFDKLVIYLNDDDAKPTQEYDIDADMKIRVLKENTHSYSFSTEFIYNQNGVNEACFYVLCKSENGANDYFVCRDIAAVLGTKHARLPMIFVDDNVFSLYKVMVKDAYPEDEEIDFENDAFLVDEEMDFE